MASHPVRYHPALVTLHWLLALALIFALTMGTLFLKTIPNASPDKILALQGHMAAGGLILVLTLVRLLVRLVTARPPAVSTGNAAADRLAAWVHGGLYLLVLMMAGSGIALSVQAGLPDIVFGGQGALPKDFAAYAPRAVHGLVAKALMLLIALHVAAALFHHFVKRDGLLRRMWFGTS